MTKEGLLQSMELAALAYQKHQALSPGETLTVIDDPGSGIQCFLRRRGEALSVTFRGTDSARDWHTDFSAWKKDLPYGNTASPIRVHAGFIDAYKSPPVRERILGAAAEDIRRVNISGHSYGAALAVLCAVDLQYNFPCKDYEVVLFGCPRVGNRAFQKSYDKRVFKTLRVENGNDIVTKVPPVLWGFRHVGIPIRVGPPRFWGGFSFLDHHPQAYYRRLFTELP